MKCGGRQNLDRYLAQRLPLGPELRRRRFPRLAPEQEEAALFPIEKCRVSL